VGIVGLVLLYFWTQGALGSLIDATVVFPNQHYADVNTVHYAQRIFAEYWDKWVMAGGLTWFLPIAAILIAPFLFIAALPALMLVLGIRYNWRCITLSLPSIGSAGGLVVVGDSSPRYLPSDIRIAAADCSMHSYPGREPKKDRRSVIADARYQRRASGLLQLLRHDRHESHFTQTRVGLVAGLGSDRVFEL